VVGEHECRSPGVVSAPSFGFVEGASTGEHGTKSGRETAKVLGWDYRAKERVQHGRSVGELWVVAGSVSGIQVSVTGVMRCETGDQNNRAGQSRAV
jgi:hypothetical protein